MQFIPNGPDLPEALLHAHEDGRVVLFCGAGISYPAGLPSFRGLVDAIYDQVGTTRNPIEEEAYRREKYDATLDLLERRLPAQRVELRTALAKVLKTNPRRKGVAETHAALCQLACTREGAFRLVTTNFDRLFEQVSKRAMHKFTAFSAPMLPVPKKSRWNGLVYLHGLLPKNPDIDALHRLVLTSGDFGLAYLTERWAARFVSELFRNYVVCFVGYSIDDPVLRYMMDALAADRMQGEFTPRAYALAASAVGEEQDKKIEWEAKGVTPILYDSANGHMALHSTLKVWAETWSAGVLGRERIVVDYAIARPTASTNQDDFVGRMLWALSHKSGLPAKRFADFNPAPSLDWLTTFTDQRFIQADLDRFGVSPDSEVNDQLRFSLIRRPAPYHRSPSMGLAFGGSAESGWDDVMFYLARWLTRHLNDPTLILWVVAQGGLVHDRLSILIEERLNELARLEREGKTDELNDIRSNAPNAIPNAQMRRLWQLLLAGLVRSPWHRPDLYRWTSRLKRDGLSAALRLELREVLAPKIVLKEPIAWFEDDDTEVLDPERKRVQCELVLASDHVHATLHDLSGEHWQEALPRLFNDLQHLLRDALDLLRDLGQASDRSDRSHWDLPSISNHAQNRGFRDWAMLIELLRDAWLTMRITDTDRAGQIALAWFGEPYPTFKRLALFAATQDNCISPNQWVDWLLSDDAWWLWTVDVQRETMRLLVLQGKHLNEDTQCRLESAILTGPPRKMYRDDLEDERWLAIFSESVLLLLAKLKSSGIELGTSAAEQFVSICAAHPHFKLEANESDEFSHWMSGSGDPDYKARRDIEPAPRRRQELVEFLRRPPVENRPFYEDTWDEVCRTRFFHSLCSLRDLSKGGIWPAERWRRAIQIWGEKELIQRSWRFAAPSFMALPDEVIKEVVHSLSWYLKEVAQNVDRHEATFFALCWRILHLQLNPSTRIFRNGKLQAQPVTEAINHPVGQATQAVLNFWLRRELNDNDTLPESVEPFFTEICDTQVDTYRHGRVVLASRLITLFRVDRPWTEKHLLPRFNWTTDAIEARSAWEGFLWSPRLYKPLQLAFKAQFLETARHYAELGEHRDQYASILAYAALEPADGYEPKDFRSAFELLPQEALNQVAQAVSQVLEGAAEQGADYWRNRIAPFWQHVWPKSRNLASNEIAQSLARMSIAARDEFPAALTTVQGWLRPIEHPDYVLRRLNDSGLCGRFPNDALKLIGAVIDQPLWVSGELRECLDAIVQTAPSLAQDHSYQRLDEFCRRHGA